MRREKIYVWGLIFALALLASPIVSLPAVSVPVVSHAYSMTARDDLVTSGMSKGFEYRQLKSTMFQFDYPAGIYYDLKDPTASVDWPIVVRYRLARQLDFGWFTEATPRFVYFYYYYGYFNARSYFPYNGLLKLDYVEPWGDVEHPAAPTYSYGFTVGNSWGAQMAHLQVGSSVSVSASFSVQPGITIDFARPDSWQPGVPGKQVDSRIDAVTRDGDPDKKWIVKLGYPNWELRWIGDIYIKPLYSKEITALYNKYLLDLAVQNGLAKWADNYNHRMMSIIVVAIAQYKDDTWPGRATAYVAITYILGDNSQIGGDDTYLYLIGGR